MKLLSLLILVVLLGCTVTPKHFVQHEISFDHGIQNGGFIGYIQGGTNDGWGVITSDAKSRYDRLVERFGGTNYFTVAIIRGEGLVPFTNGTWLIDPEHNRKAQTMNRWRKESP